MKKALVLFMVVVLCLSFVGCVPMDESPAKETGEQGKELVFALNETAVFPALKITATEVKESKGKDYFTPEKGKVFVGVKFTIENVSDEEQTVSTLLMFEGYADDVKCSYSFNAACAFDDGTLDGTLAPGKKLVGWYPLEVDKNWSSIELHVLSSWLSSNPAKFVFTK